MSRPRQGFRQQRYPQQSHSHQPLQFRRKFDSCEIEMAKVEQLPLYTAARNLEAIEQAVAFKQIQQAISDDQAAFRRQMHAV